MTRSYRAVLNRWRPAACIVLGINALAWYALAREVLINGQGTAWDTHWSHWLQGHRRTGWTQVMLVVTNLHSVQAIAGYTAVVAAILAWRRQWHLMLPLLLVLPGGMLLNVLMKQVFQRTRPASNEALLHLSTYSFPSGHASATTLLYGLITLVVAIRNRPLTERLAVALLAVFTTTVVCVSRVYLGAHYASDVLAGVLEALAWLAVCVLMLSSARRAQ